MVKKTVVIRSLNMYFIYNTVQINKHWLIDRS